MRFSIGIVIAPALLSAALAVAPTRAAQYGVRLHPTIYLCADDAELAVQLQSELPTGFTLIDGNLEPPPADPSDTTFAFIGRRDAAPYSEACIARYPGATEYLYKIAKGASVHDPMFAGYEDRSNLVPSNSPVSSISWEQQGQYSEWFVGYCFTPFPQPCFDAGDDPARTLLDMARWPSLD